MTHSLRAQPDTGHPMSLSTAPLIAKNNRRYKGLLIFAVYSPTMSLCTDAHHSRSAFSLCPSLAANSPTSSSALVLEWSRVLSPNFVQPGCTVTANRTQAGREGPF